MHFVRQQWLRSLHAVGLLATLGAGCAADDPAPTGHSQDLRVSEEVFRMFCMRVARDENPGSPDGIPFNALCDGRPAPAPGTPRLSALVQRRPELITALDQVFAEVQGPAVKDVALFEENELHSFLGSLVPFYDDETMPRSTRALAAVAGKLLDPADPRGQKVLDTLARLSPRTGYRSSADIVAAVRPMLKYERMDQLSQELLGFVAEGGAGHPAFVELLKVATLEMAEPGDVLNDQQANETTLHVTTQLLFTENDAFKTASDPSKFFVRRDNRGQALPIVPLPAGLTPFAVAGRPDIGGIVRLPDGRAASPDGTPLYQYGDASRTLLAALMHDQKTLLERKAGAPHSPVENLLRGLRPVLGANVSRSEEFKTRVDPQSGAAMTGRLTFQGPNVEQSPLVELVQGLTNILRYPETDRLLAVVQELLDKHESEASGPVYAGLAIDKRADDPKHKDTAVLIGVDGQKGSPQEFWDDLIAMGMRMAQRKDLLKDVVLEFAKPQGAAQAHLMARFMAYKDEITYEGWPAAKPGADGKYSTADAAKMNELVKHELAAEVVRTPGASADVGMNRSLFQRLLSTIQATNKVPNCNKEGAKLLVHTTALGLLPLELNFPTPEGGVLELVGCGPPTPSYADGYPSCKFVEQPNGAETHMRSIIKKASAKPKDTQLQCAADFNGQDIGVTQETDSQIKGFTLSPTPESIARFMYAPRNKFVNDLFNPLPTRHGVNLVDYEPNYLFALEVKDSTVLIDGKPQSFLDVSAGLTGAFDKHETFEQTPNGEVSKGGYMFADVLELLHDHWDSRKPGNCPADPATDPSCMGLGLTGTACTAGCTQSLDPKGKFYSKQTNLVSYEPLLIEALQEERIADVLADATKVMQGITIACEDGKSRDGVTILGDFLERMLTPDESLTYFSDKRKYAKTNTCTEVTTDAAGAASCACPKGSMPVDAAVPDSACMTSTGGIVPRGKIIANATPMHLILDALNRFDAVFADSSASDRLAPWREARSALVDTFLTVNRQPDPTDTTGTKFTYTMANPRSRAVGIQLISWVRDRVKLYRDAGGDSLNSWANGLPGRLSSVLGHPLVGRALDLLDEVWKSDGPAREMAQFNAYLLDPANTEAFAGVVLAAADTLEVIDRDRDLSPAISFAALMMAENAFAALDAVQTGAVAEADKGTVMRTLDVTRKIADLNKGKATASPISRLLKNAVLPNPAQGGKSPLETLIDAVADVNRDTPLEPSSKPHTPADNRKVFEQLKSFLSDQDRGLERLYNVIRERKVK